MWLIAAGSTQHHQTFASNQKMFIKSIKKKKKKNQENPFSKKKIIQRTVLPDRLYKHNYSYDHPSLTGSTWPVTVKA